MSGKDSEPVFARIICAEMDCGDGAQMVAVAEQQQEVLHLWCMSKETRRGRCPLRVSFGLPERIRTFGLQSRSLTRYPAVPRAEILLHYYTTQIGKSQAFFVV